MEKLEYKKQLVQTCIDMLEESIQTAKETIEELQQSANEYEGDNDIFDSFKADLMKKKDMHIQQYQKYKEELKILLKIPLDQLHDTVKFGSVVVTDKQKMLVSVSLGTVHFNGDKYIAISTQVPIFNAMRDLKAGDSFDFNKNTFKIKSIF